MYYSTKHSLVYSAINEKINRIQRKFSVNFNWDDSQNEVSKKNEDTKVLIVENEWIDANNVTEGGKILGIEKYIKESDSRSVIYFSPKGSDVQNHSHEQEELCVCLSGKVKFIIENDEEVILEPINHVRIEPNKIHRVEFLEDSELIVTWSSDKTKN